MNKSHAIRQFNIHACITLEKKLSGLLETVCNIMQLSICGAPKEVRFFGVFFQINDVYMNRTSESWQLHAEAVLELLRT